MVTSSSTTDPYTLEQAEEDISILRGQVNLLQEILSQNQQLAGGPAAGPPTLGYQQYMDGPGFPQFISAADGNMYDAACVTCTPSGGSSGQTVNSVTAAPIGNATIPLAANTVYDVSGCLLLNPNQAAGAAVISLLSTLGFNWIATAFTEFTPPLNSNGASGTGNGQVSTSRSASFQTANFGANVRMVIIEGQLSNGASANQITFQAACTVAADTYVIMAGSKIRLRPVVAVPA